MSDGDTLASDHTRHSGPGKSAGYVVSQRGTAGDTTLTVECLDRRAPASVSSCATSSQKVVLGGTLRTTMRGFSCA